jgi:hypothetical protein
MALTGCTEPICISTAEACELSCPDPANCEIQESNPEQLACPDRVDAHPAPSAGPFTCGTTTCERSESYCNVVVPGVPDATASYTCTVLADECDGVATCECLGYEELGSGPGSCSENDGAVTVTFAAP